MIPQNFKIVSDEYSSICCHIKILLPRFLAHLLCFMLEDILENTLKGQITNFDVESICTAAIKK